MSDIYVNYNGKSGFSRAADKGALAGTAISYADFKGVSGDIKSGSDVAYGITMSSGDVQDLIANYEVDSIFTDAEKGWFFSKTASQIVLFCNWFAMKTSFRYGAEFFIFMGPLKTAIFRDALYRWEENY